MAVIWIDRPHGDLVADRHEIVGPDEERLHEADAVIVGASPWDAAMMERVPGLRIIARTGLDAGQIDVSEATRRGIAVINTPDEAVTPTAEHVLALMMAAGKTLVRHQGRLRQTTGRYETLSTGIEFGGLTLGLWVFDPVAARVAQVAQALRMRVITHDPFVTEADLPDGVELVSFEAMISESDVLSLHAPVTADSRGRFTEEVFEQCRHGMVFINCASVELVDLMGLRAAVHRGQVSNAGLDIQDPEHFNPEHPLLQRDDVLITPHVAAATVTSRRRMLERALADTLLLLDDEPVDHLLNPELASPSWDDLEA